jgi:hypothetical protein
MSAVRDHPGFAPDDYPRGIAGDDLDHPDVDPVTLTAELCAVGMWERADDGYRILDAVRVCVDWVREFREDEAARRTAEPGPERPAGTSRGAKATVTGITRFGERTAQGMAASFRCAACGEMAAVVKVARAGSTIDMGPPLGRETYDHDGLVVDYFLGSTAWHAADAQTLGAVQALINEGPVDPMALRQVDWELAPFYCPDCELNYCGKDWRTYVLFDEGFYDCTMGRCPKGHDHMVDD